MKVDPSGIVTIGECDLRLPGCRALTPAPVMAILVSLRREVAATVCRSCLEEMVRLGEWEIPGAKLSRRLDLAVYDKDERLQLVVDVQDYRRKQEADTEQWATRIRRNLVRHSAVPVYVYFLLAVYPAPFCLWLPDDAPDALPHYVFDVQAEGLHLEESGTISEHQQADAVAAWLKSIMDVSARAAEPQAWLDDTGLREAIQGGKIVREMPMLPRREPQAA